VNARAVCRQSGGLHSREPRSGKMVPIAATRRATSRGGVYASSTVPPAPLDGAAPVEDWRAAEAERQRIKADSLAATAAAKAVYDRQQQAARGGPGKVPPELAVPLADLPEVEYITSEGLIADCSKAGARATVYAIFDAEHALQYVGMSRSINPSLRLHLARMPAKCHYVKVAHVASPNRAVLQQVQDNWVAENGGPVPGNDGGELQNLWENALDCKTRWTAEEEKEISELPEGPQKKKALKVLARRFEADIKAELEGRGIKEQFRFDPKLKDLGLLDLKNMDAAPAKPPATKPPSK